MTSKPSFLQIGLTFQSTIGILLVGVIIEMKPAISLLNRELQRPSLISYSGHSQFLAKMIVSDKLFDTAFGMFGKHCPCQIQQQRLPIIVEN